MGLHPGDLTALVISLFGQAEQIRAADSNVDPGPASAPWLASPSPSTSRRSRTVGCEIGPRQPGLSGFGMRHWPTRQRRKDKDVGDIRMAADTGLGQGYAIMINRGWNLLLFACWLGCSKAQGAIPAGAGDELGRH